MADRFTGVKGVLAASPRTATALTKVLRAAPHGYTPDMIKDEEIARLAAFLGGGLHDTDRFINRRTKAVKGNPVRGAGLYQGTCAACHGFDGKTLNWGTKEEPSYVGTEARSLPWEVAHKIRNAHPGSNMINLRAFPMQDTIDILAYTQTLPEK